VKRFIKLIFFLISLLGCEEKPIIQASKETNISNCPDDIAYPNIFIKEANINQMIKKAEAGDKRITATLVRYYERNPESNKFHYWLSKSANRGDISSQSELVQYLNVIGLKVEAKKLEEKWDLKNRPQPNIDEKYLKQLKQQYISNDDLSSQYEIISWTSNKYEKELYLKKFHLEYVYIPEKIYDLAHHGQKIEYRDDDPKGVFFDENGSVINFE